MALFGGDTNFVGVDIGTSGVRLVQLKHGAAKPYLVTYGDVEVPPGLTSSDSTLDQDKLARIIKDLVNDARVSTKNVVAGIPAVKVYSSVITTPKLNQDELAKGVRYQAEHYIPMPMDQVKLDWSVVEENTGKDSQEMEVMLVAAPNILASKYLNIFEKAGLELQAIEPNSLAMSRALVVPASSVAVMVLDMGSVSSDLVILHNNKPKLIRSISVGGTAFVKSTAQHLGLDDKQAEQFVRKFGLSKNKLEGQVATAIKPGLDNLLSEIDKSTKFFLGRYEGVKLEKIVITGGASTLPELPAYLATATGLPVEIGNPWVNISYPASLQDKLVSLATHYAVAAGLALRNLG